MATDTQQSSNLLGQRLVDAGIISPDQLRIALTEQDDASEPLGRILVRLGFVTEAVMREQLGEALGQESVALDSVVPDPAALALIPKALAQRYGIVPVSCDTGRGVLAIAMADTFNLLTMDRLRAHLGTDYDLRPLLAGEAEINEAIDRFYGYELSVDGILHEIETGEIDYASLQTETGAYSHPIVRLVDAVLADAVKREASDVHFEPEEGFVRIRYRIDGVLRQIRSLHINFCSPIAVRLKVMSGMNIAETRAPQDGRISLSIGGHVIDFRVSAVRTTHGENIVLRILDRHKGIRTLDTLGSDLTSLPLTASIVVATVSATIVVFLSALSIPASFVIIATMSIIGLGWGRATRTTTVAEGVRGSSDTAVTMGALAGDEAGEELPDIGEEDPDDIPEASELFDPSTTARVVLMQNVVPVLATVGAYTTFRFVPFFGF